MSRLSSFLSRPVATLTVAFGLSLSASAEPPLTQAQIDASGFCKAFEASVPVASALTIRKCSYTTGKINNGNFGCGPNDKLTKLLSDCKSPTACNLTPDAVQGKADTGLADLFRGLLRVHDKTLIDSLLIGPDGNQYLAGSCLQEDIDPSPLALAGLAMTGEPGDVAALDALLAEQWLLDSVSAGAETRLQIAKAYQWLGTKAGATSLAKLLEIEHTKRYSGREFREMALTTLGQWGSDAAVAYCADNLRDIKDEADLGACLLYLARLGKAEHAGKAIRQVERARNIGLIGLGLLGGAEVKTYLADLKEKSGDGPAYVAIDLAQVLAGNDKSWAKVEAILGAVGSPAREHITMVGFLAARPAAAKKAAAFLKKQAPRWKKESADRHAMSVAIRAQLGEAEAIPELVSLIGSPDKDVREQAAIGVGGDYGNVWSAMPGFGLVVDERIVAALASAHRDEGEFSIREKQGHAMLAIRGALRAAK